MSGRALPGLPLRREVALASGRSRVVAVAAPLAWPTLVPATFRRAVHGALPRPEIVRLGTLQALRYRPLRLRGAAGAVTLFAVPQPREETLLACSSSTAAELRTCEGVVASLRLAGASRTDLRPSSSYAKALNAAIAGLAGRREAAVRKLAAAGTAAAQSTALARIAAAYSRATRQVARAAPSAYAAPAHRRLRERAPPGGAGVHLACRRSASGRRTRYDALRRILRSRERDLQSSIGAFRSLGFTG